MNSILICGASGLVGRRLLSLCREARPEWEIFGTCYNRPVPGLIRMDATDEKSVSKLFDEIRPEIVINCIGNPSASHCELHKSEAKKVNTAVAATLADCCNSYDARMIHLSTDMVYLSSEHSLDENSPLGPVSYYGKTKLRAEQQIQKKMCAEQLAIIRFPVVIDPSMWLVAYLERQEETSVDNVRRLYPIFSLDIAKAILLLAENGESGIFNASGRDCTTKFALLKLISKSMGLSSDHLSSGAEKTTGARPSHLRLNTEKIEGLGFNPLSISGAVSKFSSLEASDE